MARKNRQRVKAIIFWLGVRGVLPVASTGWSIAVDQWRAKHHNRVANACGGTGSNDYAQVMEYAEIRYRELVEAEG